MLGGQDWSFPIWQSKPDRGWARLGPRGSPAADARMRVRGARLRVMTFVMHKRDIIGGLSGGWWWVVFRYSELCQRDRAFWRLLIRRGLGIYTRL